jgi:uncharacterized membrane protein
MAGMPSRPPLRDTWLHLTGEERSLLQTVLKRSLGRRGPETTAGETLTFGQRLADRVTNRIGSWPFITVQSFILLVWIAVNTIAWRQHWDPYPFILLNLVLSFQAAYAAPIIMMSQNRQNAKDREKAEADYEVDRQAELDIAAVHARLDELTDRQWTALLDVQQQQLEILIRIEALTREVHGVTIQQDPTHDEAQRETGPFLRAGQPDESERGPKP